MTLPTGEAEECDIMILRARSDTLKGQLEGVLGLRPKCCKIALMRHTLNAAFGKLELQLQIGASLRVQILEMVELAEAVQREFERDA
ncbi:hypothetical protein SS50377_20460 [Spironucleus salmonicida]|uniref:Uncharacterized protein n=1 Tax=Spironucleus salmonicida TaxID=348837 RepID=V6LLN2_9EUKA|nr:hypothetical protein SS50377_20460 [Spironucleus salmonicida]|eukprot:EST45610.1 Hypothetical protein SS50377_14464 [Spironucleus salmonicida]